MPETARSFFASSRLLIAGTLLLLFGLGLGIRLYDLTDLPLDFHPTRQLFSALKARGMYYQSLPAAPAWQRETAIRQAKLKVTVEPEVLERLTAFTYRFIGEQLWAPRLYSALFWVIGGIFLFLLVRDLISPDGAVLATAFYLFLPYAVSASRSFQPDPLMVALIISFWWAVNRWAQRPAWGWAALAGLLGGLAIFIKLVAAFFVAGAGLGAVLGRHRIREALRNPQLWALIGLGILPGAAYVARGVFVSGDLARQFGGRFIPALLLDPLNYLRWSNMIAAIMPPLVLALGLLGLFFFTSKSARAFAISLWAAYLLFGLYFDYHIATHDYYSLPLIPIVAISLAPLGERMLPRLTEAGPSSAWLRAGVILVLLYGLGATVWEVRTTLKSVDYRPEAAFWADIGERLGAEASVVALTQDYGSRLAYWGWLNAAVWPSSGDSAYHNLRGGKQEFAELFASLAGKRDFFLVTDFTEFERQPLLQEQLYSNYPIFAQGDGFVIFDLGAPISQ